jgi:hypothetical protein
MHRASRPVAVESIRFIREELDEWERRTGRRARLAGPSTHYNVSIDAHSPNATPARLDAPARLLMPCCRRR